MFICLLEVDNSQQLLRGQILNSLTASSQGMVVDAQIDSIYNVPIIRYEFRKLLHIFKITNFLQHYL